jgi:hypothetical protein
MVYRVSAVDEGSYVHWKFPMNMAHNWSHKVTNPSGRLMSHDLATSVNVVDKKLVLT